MREMVFAACCKVYSTVSCRRFMSNLADAQAKGYLSRVPHFNSIFNYLELPEMTAVFRSLIERSSVPMKAIETRFALDASSLTTCRYVRWYDAKYGAEMERHDWVKVHLMCGVTTNIVTAVEISGAYGAHSTRFQALVDTTSKHFRMEEVCADKAYLSRDNPEHAANYGATPYVPFKTNSTAEGSRTSLWDALYYRYMWRRDDFLEHYHRRSLVESTFSMLKAKFGEMLRSKGDVAQMNELLCKVLCHTICCVIQSMYELGIEADFPRYDA
jgi:transposase